MMLQKWGGIASFVLAVTFVVAPLLYFVGTEQAIAPLVYNVADSLYGPVWGVSLVIAVFALRERLGKRASHRMTLALLAASLAAGALVSAALIRSANRHYHLTHPELNLEMSTPVLVVWATIVAGVAETGQHFFGWSLVLIGSAGWTTRLLPRVFSLLCFAAGAMALFDYLRPEDEVVSVLGMAVSIWLGILLWRSDPRAMQAPEKSVEPLDQA